MNDTGRLPAAFLTPGSSSFLDFLSAQAPELLPARRATQPGGIVEAPHGTTILASRHADGVVLVGDRRITMGSTIANRDYEKVFPADEYAAVGIAGTVGVAVEMVRLFQLELEHYEKIEGVALSLVGKANRLSTLVRGNLSMAMQGMAVVPLLVGYDQESGTGRIFSYDVTGGQTEERDFAATGSGSVHARGAMKKTYRPGMTRDEVVTMAVEALYDAAEEDSATGGPDAVRALYPMVTAITADGYNRLTDAEVAEIARAVIDGRHAQPNGPRAPLL